MSTVQILDYVKPHTEGESKQGQPDLEAHKKHFIDELREHLFPMCPRFQQAILREYLAELDGQLSPVDQLKQMESQIREVVHSLPAEIRSIIGILSRLSVLDDIDYANDLLHNPIQDSKIEQTLSRAGADGDLLIMKTAWELLKRAESLNQDDLF